MVVIHRSQLKKESLLKYSLYALGDKNGTHVVVDEIDEDQFIYYHGTEADCKGYITDVDERNGRGE
jgi:hypothetical protein